MDWMLAEGRRTLDVWRLSVYGNEKNVLRSFELCGLCVIITLVLAFVFLHESFTMKSLIGCVLIGAGTLLMVL